MKTIQTKTTKRKKTPRPRNSGKLQELAHKKNILFDKRKAAAALSNQAPVTPLEVVRLAPTDIKQDQHQFAVNEVTQEAPAPVVTTIKQEQHQFALKQLVTEEPAGPTVEPRPRSEEAANQDAIDRAIMGGAAGDHQYTKSHVVVMLGSVSQEILAQPGVRAYQGPLFYPAVEQLVPVQAARLFACAELHDGMRSIAAIQPLVENLSGGKTALLLGDYGVARFVERVGMRGKKNDKAWLPLEPYSKNTTVGIDLSPGGTGRGLERVGRVLTHWARNQRSEDIELDGGHALTQFASRSVFVHPRGCRPKPGHETTARTVDHRGVAWYSLCDVDCYRWCLTCARDINNPDSKAGCHQFAEVCPVCGNATMPMAVDPCIQTGYKAIISREAWHTISGTCWLSDLDALLTVRNFREEVAKAITREGGADSMAQRLSAAIQQRRQLLLPRIVRAA